MPAVTGRSAAALLAALTGATAGCVDRRFVVTTNVPGAQIDVDGKPLGVSPVDSPYVYAGEYEFTASAPGHDTVKERVRLRAKWYQYPPFDFFAEVLYPGRIEDVRRVHLDLPLARPYTDQELLGRGAELRARGMSLPPPAVPNDPPKGATTRPAAVAPPQPGPAALPATALPVTPQVPASLLGPLANPRDGGPPNTPNLPPQPAGSGDPANPLAPR